MSETEPTPASLLLEQTRLSKRSALYRWLHGRYDDLAPTMNGPRPPWAALALTIRDSGDWAGPTPSRQDVRATWLRIEGDRAPRTAPVTQAPKAAQPAPKVTKPSDDDDPPDEGLTLRNITIPK